MSEVNWSNFELHVFITHFVPPKSNAISKFQDFLYPRLSFQYLRSWARLIKHGTRGFQPWKKDIMTEPRKKMQLERDSNLAQVIRTLEMIDALSINLNIYTNADLKIAKTSNRTEINVIQHLNYNKMNSRNNSPWTDDYSNSPWNLLWTHKSRLKELALEKSENKRIFLVLENDVLFTQQNLNYWIFNREKLRSSGLVPSFIRIEFSKFQSDWILIDIHDLNILQRLRILEASNNLVLQIPCLYSGLIVLDDELLSEYVASKAIDKSSSKELIWWDLGARASMGIQFVNIPNGFSDRYVIPFTTSKSDIPKEALVHHLPNLYASVDDLIGKYPALSFVNKAVRAAE